MNLFLGSVVMEPVVFRTGKSRLPLLQLPPVRLNTYNNYNSGFLSSFLSPLSSILHPPQARLPLPRPHHHSFSVCLSELGLCSPLFWGFAADGDCLKLIGDLHHGLPFGLREDEEGVETPDRADAGEQQEAVRVQGFLGHGGDGTTDQEQLRVSEFKTSEQR